VLDPLYTVISFIMLRFHDLFSLVLDPAAGITWTLSIMFLVITIRALLFPLFVKQIKAQRRMQLIQPEMKELREKYKGDRERLNQEMSRLMKDNNANPIAGCLPLLVQIPVFISLFHVLRQVKPGGTPLYGWTQEQINSAAEAKLLGAPISLPFTATAEQLSELDANQLNVRVVTGSLIILMAVTTFLSQRQMLARNRATSEAQVQTVQKALMYIIPVSLMVSGPFFPLGVLIYWTTTNLFSLAQQQYVIRTMHQHEEQKRLREIESKQHKQALGPRPGVKPVNPRKGGQAPPSSKAQAGSDPEKSSNPGGASNASKSGKPGGSSRAAGQPSGTQGHEQQPQKSPGSAGSPSGGSGKPGPGKSSSGKSGPGKSSGKGKKR
jgi:YidC/Oxa1 family membrane protein insertase